MGKGKGVKKKLKMKNVKYKKQFVLSIGLLPSYYREVHDFANTQLFQFFVYKLSFYYFNISEMKLKTNVGKKFG